MTAREGNTWRRTSASRARARHPVERASRPVRGWWHRELRYLAWKAKRTAIVIAVALGALAVAHFIA